MKPNLVYFGSPEFSATILDSIIASNEVNVVGVVTTPDQPQGRKLLLTPSPIATLATNHNLPVYKPAKLDDANLAHLKLLKPDIFLVVSYGKIIPKSYLDTPKIGTFNIHFSLLPKYRGALCISEAIKNQDKETGVTLMVMDELLDHGPVISQSTFTIDIDDDSASLTTKLTQAAISLLASKLPEICSQNYPQTVQDESLVTITKSHKTLNRQTAFIPYEKIVDAQNRIDAKVIHALVRSLNPTPGAWTTITEQDIKIIKTSLNQDTLVLETIQVPGKSPITWKQYLAGHQPSRKNP